MGVITFASRILGLLRESLTAKYFGSSPVFSAFTLAFTVPNLFRKLLGEGALSSAFIPLYAQAVKRSEAAGAGEVAAEEDPQLFAAASVNFLCAILLGITIIGEILLVLLVWLVPMKFDTLLACKLTMVMLPYVLLVCGTAFLGAILQVHHRFAAFAFTAVISNLCLIVAMVMAAKMLDLSQEDGRLRAVYWLSWSVLVAGVLQIAALMPSLRSAGFRFRIMLHVMTPAVRKMLWMTVPVAAGASVLQIGVMLDKGIAFFLSPGVERTALSWFGTSVDLPLYEGATQRLNWAQYMYQFPLGVFAIALSTAIFPKLSRDAADIDRTAFNRTLRRGIEAALLIGLPASAGLIIVRYPAVKLLFQRGEFKPFDTYWVALSVAVYSAAIWAFSLQQILNRAFYALHDTRTPLMWTIWNLLINLAVEIPLIFTPLREAGMAVGTMVSFAIQAVAMLWVLDRRVGGIGLGPSMRNIGKMLLATLAMLAACVAIQRLPGWPAEETQWAWAMQLTILMGVGGGVYFVMCQALGLPILQVLKRRPPAAADVPPAPPVA
jgi:putative peptidoglycan lipid II flippase